MKFNFCPTCGEYLKISFDAQEEQAHCPLGHSLQIPKTLIIAAALLTDSSKILMERALHFGREHWALPHIEVRVNEQPEVTLSHTLQTKLLHKVSIDGLMFANGEDQMFHLFYDVSLLKSKAKPVEHVPQPYAWYAWHDVPWNKIMYEQHKHILLQWLTIIKDQKINKTDTKLISQYRGIKIL